MKYLFLFLCLFISNPNKLPRTQFSSSYLSYTIYDCDYVDSDDGKIIPHIKGGFPPYDFYWKGPEGYYSTDSIISNIYPGKYYLRAEDRLCGYLNDTIEVRAITSSKLNEGRLRINEVYPNPFDDFINIKLTTPTKREIRYKITDIKGAHILEGNQNIGANRQILKVNIPEVRPGLYLLIIYDGVNQVYTRKLRKSGSA